MSSSVQGASVAVPPISSLEHFPVPLFSSVMGVTGLAIAWQKAHTVFGMPTLVGDSIRLLASALFLLLAALYAAKWLRHPKAASMESKHPVRISFLATIPIGMLLLATAWLEDAPHMAVAFWTAGTALQLALTLRTVGSWLHHTHYDIKHANPAWFVPVVGNIIVPIAGVQIASPELSWFFFSIGIVFWVVLLPIVMNRLFFHEPLPQRLMPTIFILLAPPSVGFLAWTSLTGQVDAFSRVLFYTALFLALLLASNAPRFFRLPFAISSWAYSFPLAALTIAVITMCVHVGGMLMEALAIVLLSLLSAIVAALTLRTLVAARQGHICVPE